MPINTPDAPVSIDEIEYGNSDKIIGSFDSVPYVNGQWLLSIPDNFTAKYVHWIDYDNQPHSFPVYYNVQIDSKKILINDVSECLRDNKFEIVGNYKY